MGCSGDNPPFIGSHDTIVPELSQQGGLSGQKITTFVGITHAIASPTETDHPPVFEEVLKLLRTPVDSPVFGSFGARKSTPPCPTTATPCPPAATSQQTTVSSRSFAPGLFVTLAVPPSLGMSPQPGTVVRPGDVVQVTFTIDGGGPIDQVLFRMGEELRLISVTGPLSVEYTVPTDRAGRIDVTALAFGIGGDNYLVRRS